MGLGRFFRRAKWDRERLEEIESYVQIETDENIARGMEYPEACAAARRKFGNRSLIREEIYSMNTIVFFDTLARDLRVLLGGGYAIASVTLADLFPQTFHLESVTTLSLD